MKTVDGYRLTRAGLDDTSPEAHRVLADAFRRMTVGRKWQLVSNLYEQARSFFAIGQRSRNAAITPEEIHERWLRTNLPDFLRSRVMPGQTSPGPEELGTLRTVVAVLDRFGLDYALGGSIASSLLGKPRFTHDADLTVVPFPGREAEFAASFPPDYYVSVSAVEEAVRRRSSFNVINTMTSFKVDFFVRKNRPFELSLMERRRATPLFDVEGESIQVVSPEDCILLKLEWYRKANEVLDNQWEDVQGVLRVQGPDIDLAYLRHWANELNVADLLEEALGDADLLN